MTAVLPDATKNALSAVACGHPVGASLRAEPSRIGCGNTVQERRVAFSTEAFLGAQTFAASDDEQLVRSDPILLAAANIAPIARRDQILRNVVSGVPIEMVDLETPGLHGGSNRKPFHNGATPMARMRTWADLCVQDRPMFSDRVARIRERVAGDVLLRVARPGRSVHPAEPLCAAAGAGLGRALRVRTERVSAGHTGYIHGNSISRRVGSLT